MAAERYPPRASDSTCALRLRLPDTREPRLPVKAGALSAVLGYLTASLLARPTCSLWTPVLLELPTTARPTPRTRCRQRTAAIAARSGPAGQAVRPAAN